MPPRKASRGRTWLRPHQSRWDTIARATSQITHLSFWWRSLVRSHVERRCSNLGRTQSRISPSKIRRQLTNVMYRNKNNLNRYFTHISSSGCQVKHTHPVYEIRFYAGFDSRKPFFRPVPVTEGGCTFPPGSRCHISGIQCLIQVHFRL